jgi:ABC-type Mn2+/Zn2+ transport system ATPase subunit
MNDPELLILDEPTPGLDPAARKSTLDLITELDKGKTTFVSSHVLSRITYARVSVAILIHVLRTLGFGGAATTSIVVPSRRSDFVYIWRLDIIGLAASPVSSAA